MTQRRRTRRESLEINPKLKVILASGYVEPEVKSNMLRFGAKAFLAKPYDPLVLARTVRQILDLQQ